MDAILVEIARLRTIYDEHAGLRARFTGAGVVTPALARQLGLIGLAGRASGQPFDVRCDMPCAPYGGLMPQRVVRTEGDVAARVAVRFDEAIESARMLQQLLRQMPAGAHQRADLAHRTPAPQASG